MKNVTIFLVLLIALMSINISADGQAPASIDKRLILSLRVKFIHQGPEIIFEHPVSQRFSLRTALGSDFLRKDDKSYRNREVIINMVSNSRSYPYRFSLGPYLKVKDSRYSYTDPNENFMLDAESALYFFGAGVTAEYRQRIGQRFMITPFTRFGVNKVILRNDKGPGITPFTDSFENDLNAGLSLSFIF